MQIMKIITLLFQKENALFLKIYLREIMNLELLTSHNPTVLFSNETEMLLKGIGKQQTIERIRIRILQGGVLL